MAEEVERKEGERARRDDDEARDCLAGASTGGAG